MSRVSPPGGGGGGIRFYVTVKIEYARMSCHSQLLTIYIH